MLFLPASVKADEYLAIEVDTGSLITPANPGCVNPFLDPFVFYSSDAGHLISALIEGVLTHIPDETGLLQADPNSEKNVQPDPEWRCPRGTQPVYDGHGQQMACIGPDPDSRGNNTWRICFRVADLTTVCIKARITCDINGKCTVSIWNWGIGIDIECTITKEGDSYKVSCRKKKLFGGEDLPPFYYQWKECPGSPWWAPVLCLCISKDKEVGEEEEECIPIDPNSVPFLPDILPLIPGYNEAPVTPRCK